MASSAGRPNGCLRHSVPGAISIYDPDSDRGGEKRWRIVNDKPLLSLDVQADELAALQVATASTTRSSGTQEQAPRLPEDLSPRTEVGVALAGAGQRGRQELRRGGWLRQGHAGRPGLPAGRSGRRRGAAAYTPGDGYQYGGQGTVAPTINGSTLTFSLRDALRAGKTNKVRVIAGVDRDEDLVGTATSAAVPVALLRRSTARTRAGVAKYPLTISTRRGWPGGRWPRTPTRCPACETGTRSAARLPTWGYLIHDNDIPPYRAAGTGAWPRGRRHVGAWYLTPRYAGAGARPGAAEPGAGVRDGVAAMAAGAAGAPPWPRLDAANDPKVMSLEPAGGHRAGDRRRDVRATRLLRSGAGSRPTRRSQTGPARAGSRRPTDSPQQSGGLMTTAMSRRRLLGVAVGAVLAHRRGGCPDGGERRARRGRRRTRSPRGVPARTRSAARWSIRRSATSSTPASAAATSASRCRTRSAIRPSRSAAPSSACGRYRRRRSSRAPTARSRSAAATPGDDPGRRRGAERPAAGHVRRAAGPRGQPRPHDRERHQRCRHRPQPGHLDELHLDRRRSLRRGGRRRVHHDRPALVLPRCGHRRRAGRHRHGGDARRLDHRRVPRARSTATTAGPTSSELRIANLGANRQYGS